MSKQVQAEIAHKQRVARISRTVNQFYAKNVPFRIFHGSSNSTRAAVRQEVVDISDFNHVIWIDEVRKTVLVEPGIAMDVLVKRLLRYNLMPAVVPEFPGITAGGAFAGTAAESSSFRFGHFHKTVSAIEIVLGNGEVIQALPNENADLFMGSAGSLGTLGIITKLEIQVVDCDGLIEVTYHPVSSHQQALRLFEDVGEDVDFIDSVMFSSRQGVVVEGRLVKKHMEALPIMRFTRARDPWFFTHLHKKIRCDPSSERHRCLTCHWTQHSRKYRQDSATLVELVPIKDFLFRYDRGVFWMAAYGWAPNFWNRFTRIILDPLWHTRFQYRVVHVVGGTPHIIQDLAVPEHKADNFLQYLHDDLKIYPLWLCPISHDSKYLMHTAKTSVEHTRYFVNVGVWGSPNYGSDYLRGHNFEQFISHNRRLERKVAEVSGLKWLYACNYYQEDEFWRIYDKDKYDELRMRWKADRLPNIWQKVKEASKK